MESSKVDLAFQFAGLRIANPVILASGVIGVSAGLLRRAAREGAGAVITKSFGITAREGNPGPVVTEVSSGFLNSLGLPNPGADEMKNEIVEARNGGVPVIASVYGFNEDEYAKVAKLAKEACADALELNVSCPHVQEVGIEIGQNPELVYRVTKAAKSSFSGPLIVKLSPNVSDVVEIGEAAAKAGADALTATNTVRAMAINIDVRQPILGGKFGGLSGPAIKPIAVRCVYELYERVPLPIIGCGGIAKWQDIVEFMLAGASAVQVGSAVAYGDLAVFSELVEGLRDFMSDHGYTRLEEITGTAHI